MVARRARCPTVARRGARCRRRHVAPHFTLAENLSGLDNIVLGTEPVPRPWRDRGAARRKINTIVAEKGSPSIRRARRPADGGEKQR